MSHLVPVSTTSAISASSKSELARILALPRREIVDCEREKGTRRWSPKSQALVEVVTSLYTRGQRLSCACRTRRVTARAGGEVTILQEGPPQLPPPLPIHTTVAEFAADNSHDPATVRIVAELRAGATAELPGLGHLFCATELNPSQSWTLWELPRVGGALGLISVGGGKTWSGILAPLTMPHIGKWVILIKPDQRLHYRSAYLRIREHFRVPSVVFDQTGLDGSHIVLQDRVLGRSVPVLHVVPYSVLSSTKSSLLLDQIDPDGMVGDEMHFLGNRKSARTLRWSRFMARRNLEGRNVVFAGWSGSTVKKSILDASHLSAYALGFGSPYPLRESVAEEFAAVVDPVAMPDRESPTAEALDDAFGSGRVRSLAASYGFYTDDSIREGHRDWVVQTPGVISTRSSSINCSITIRERKPPKMPDAVVAALKMVRGGERPDGDVLLEDVQQARVANEVGRGFFNYWKFRREDSDELILEWFSARKLFMKEVRAKIAHGEANLDSLAHCCNAAERAYREPRYDGDLPVWPANNWPAWARVKDRVPHEEKVFWIGQATASAPAILDEEGHLVGEFLAKDAAQWAKENCGIVWCQSRAFGMRVAELAGLHYHAGGAEAEARIMAEDGSRSIIASMNSHGTGRDGLQHRFSKQLIAEIPSSGDRWEQLLGRLAREGQKEDTVETEIYRHIEESRAAFRQAIMYAEFIEGTTPNRQLLLAADIDFEA